MSPITVPFELSLCNREKEKERRERERERERRRNEEGRKEVRKEGRKGE
jgi:hypothetical protein